MSLDWYNRKAQEKDDQDDFLKNVQDICSMQTRCYAFYIHDVTQVFETSGSQPVWHQGLVFWKTIFKQPGG